jgi:hypothetical protein
LLKLVKHGSARRISDREIYWMSTDEHWPISMT